MYTLGFSYKTLDKSLFIVVEGKLMKSLDYSQCLYLLPVYYNAKDDDLIHYTILTEEDIDTQYFFIDDYYIDYFNEKYITFILENEPYCVYTPPLYLDKEKSFNLHIELAEKYKSFF